MKKRVIFALIGAIFLLSACGKAIQSNPPLHSGSSPSAVVSSSGAVTAIPSAAPAIASSSVSEIQSSPPYTIETAIFSKNDIHIEYPQIKGLGDSKRETAINDLIKNDILKSKVYDIIQYFKETYGMDIALSVDLSFKVTLYTDRLLSVKFEGADYIKGGAHPSVYFYGMTIDLKNVAKLNLSDFTAIDDTLVHKVSSNTSKINKFGSDADNQVLINAVLDNLKDSGDHFFIFDLRNRQASDFCITPDSLIVNVNVAHVLGTYVLIEIPGDYTNIIDHSSIYDDFLSRDTEKLIICFKTESEKTMSICVSEGDKRHIVYRFGTKYNIEFQYIQSNSSSNNLFTYVDKPGNYSLTFKNEGYEYSVYQDSSSGTGENFGVKVTELSSGKVTDIKGVKNSLIGDLYFISAHDLRK